MAPDAEARRRFLERIRTNIASHGQHITLVQQGESPRFAYTIGLTEADAPELILAGAVSLSRDEIVRTLNHAAAATRRGALAAGGVLEVPEIGALDVRAADRSWSDRAILGALDIYERDTLPALQLVPAGDHRTIDVPDMTRPWDAGREPMWRSLSESRDHAVPPAWNAAIDLDALRGRPVVEAARWDEDHWELFSGPGPDFSEEQVRLFPLGLLLAADPSLEPVARLGIGAGLWREPTGPWLPWGNG